MVCCICAVMPGCPPGQAQRARWGAETAPAAASRNSGVTHPCTPAQCAPLASLPSVLMPAPSSACPALQAWWSGRPCCPRSTPDACGPLKCLWAPPPAARPFVSRRAVGCGGVGWVAGWLGGGAWWVVGGWLHRIGAGQRGTRAATAPTSAPLSLLQLSLSTPLPPLPPSPAAPCPAPASPTLVPAARLPPPLQPTLPRASASCCSALSRRAAAPASPKPRSTCWAAAVEARGRTQVGLKGGWLLGWVGGVGGWVGGWGPAALPSPACPPGCLQTKLQTQSSYTS